MSENREHLASRLGFILLSAGCAIGLGNVWTFPWRVGNNGGGAFVLCYVIALIVLGIPIMTAEFAIGRKAQTSPAKMYQAIEKKNQKWHIQGYAGVIGNILLMMFYTTIAGYFFHYLFNFIKGTTSTLTYSATTANLPVNVGFMALVVIVGFLILTFNVQKGLEKVTKVMMFLLFILMIALAIHSCTMSGTSAGLEFYLKPDFSKINGKTIVAAMNQAFFSLSLGMGAMAIFGSYTSKENTLLRESVTVIALDTLVAILAGFIIFPAAFTFGINPDAGPELLFTTMVTVFNNMAGGRIWGALFFLFMIFAAMSTVLAVFEGILASVREITNWSRVKGCIICMAAMLLLCLPMALSGSVLKNVHPFGQGTGFLDLWDYFVETIIQPSGSLIYLIFVSYKFGWGWNGFVKEANTGKGLKVRNWMKVMFKYVSPAVIAALFIYGVITFSYH